MSPNQHQHLAMASLEKSSITIQSNSHHGIAPGDAWTMAPPGTPAPPPLYHTQWLPSPPESMQDFYRDDQRPFCDHDRICGSGSEGSAGAMNGEFGAKLLEKDQASFAAQEAQIHHNRKRVATIAASSKAAKKKYKSRASEVKRPPALAATHPAFYQPRTSIQSDNMDSKLAARKDTLKPPSRNTRLQVSNTDKIYSDTHDGSVRSSSLSLPTPSSTTLPTTRPSAHAVNPTKPPKQQTSQSTSHYHISSPSKLPWQRYTDPKHLLSHNPAFSDPGPSYLTGDIAGGRPVVISAVPLLALPFGDMIEAAWVNKDEQVSPDKPADGKA